MHFGDVVDQFHDQNGFAHAGTAEQTNFTTLGIRSQQVDNFDTCHEDFGFCRLVFEFRSRLVDGAEFGCANVAFFVNRLADNVQDPAQCGFANWNGDWAAGVFDCLTTNEPFRRVHSNAANSTFAEVLGNFQNQFLAVVFGCQRVQNFRQVVAKLDVNHGANHLSDFALCVSHFYSPILRAPRRPR